MLCKACVTFCQEAWTKRVLKENGLRTRWVTFEMALHSNVQALAEAVAAGCSLCAMIQRGLEAVVSAENSESSTVFLELVTEPWRRVKAPYLQAFMRTRGDEDESTALGRARIELQEVPSSGLFYVC